MKKVILIISVISLISCNKQKSKFMYKYEYTTEQTEEYSKQHKYNIKSTALGDYTKILSSEEIETERIRLRRTKNTQVLTDSLYYIGTYEEINN